MRRIHLAASVAAAAAAIGAPPASAAPTKLDLRAPGLDVRATAPAKVLRGDRVTLPVKAVRIAGSTAAVTHRGSLRLGAAKLRRIRVRVGSRSRLTAVVDGRRRTVFTVAAPARRRTVDAEGTSITQAPLRLTARVARIAGIRAGRVGRIDLDADATPTGPPLSDGEPPPVAASGPPTEGGPRLSPRPAGARAIVGGTALWSPRPSWLGYLAQGDGASAESGAALADGTYALPVHGGWFDPTTGTGVVETTGTARFSYPAHGIDIAVGRWSFDLARTPKAVVTVERTAKAEAKLVGKRVPVALARPSPGTFDGVSTATWADVPLTLSSEGTMVYRAYLYGSDQGRVTITARLG